MDCPEEKNIWLSISFCKCACLYKKLFEKKKKTKQLDLLACHWLFRFVDYKSFNWLLFLLFCCYCEQTMNSKWKRAGIKLDCVCISSCNVAYSSNFCILKSGGLAEYSPFPRSVPKAGRRSRANPATEKAPWLVYNMTFHRVLCNWLPVVKISLPQFNGHY